MMFIIIAMSKDLTFTHHNTLTSTNVMR